MAKRKSSETRTRNWWFVLYPESAPENWKEYIDNLCVQYVISPLHNMDVNADGEIKKEHYHVILMFESVKSYSQIKEITDDLNCPIPQAVNGLIGAVRYLIHKDNPEKYQYSKGDIVAGGGFDVENILGRSPAERRKIIKEIYDFIYQQDITEFHELTDYAFANNEDWFELLTNSHTLFFGTVIKSRRHSVQLHRKRYKGDEVE